MQLKEIPLLQPCQFTALDGKLQTGLHLATIEGRSGLTEYLIIYDLDEDRIMAFEKIYLDPENPAEFQIKGVDNPHLLNEIGDVCNTEGVFDHLPEKENDDGQTD
ncbi:MAG: hypothetical protein GQ553_00320 [Nitrosomonadaceae bacterium]|nr:hypothetical protein [Nitrosomonadaceae bacterium]